MALNVLSNRKITVAVWIASAIALGLGLGVLVASTSPWFAFAALLALIGGLLALTSAQWGLFGFVAIACLLPFAALPVKIGFTPTFLDLTMLLFFGVWLLRLLAEPEEKLASTPLDVPLIVFLGLAFVSFVLGSAYSFSQETVRHFAEIVMAVSMYFGVVSNVKNQWQLERIIRLVILGGFAAATIGIVLYFLPRTTAIALLSSLRVFNYPSGSVLRFINDDPNLPMRAISTSIDPNVLGGLLVLVTTLATSQFLSPKPAVNRWLLVPMGTAMVICLLLTYSRGSWVGLAAALLFIATVKYRRLWVLLLILAAMLLLLPQADVFVGHLISGVKFEDRAAAMRLGEYRDALTLISRYPLFGIGFGEAPSVDVYRGVSNVYLLIAEEMGLIGLGVFLSVVGLFFIHVWRCLGQVTDQALQNTLLGLTAALVGAVVAGIFDHYFFNLQFPHTVGMFWLYTGLAVAITRFGRAQHEATENTSVP